MTHSFRFVRAVSYPGRRDASSVELGVAKDMTDIVVCRADSSIESRLILSQHERFASRVYVRIGPWIGVDDVEPRYQFEADGEVALVDFVDFGHRVLDGLESLGLAAMENGVFPSRRNRHSVDSDAITHRGVGPDGDRAIREVNAKSDHHESEWETKRDPNSRCHDSDQAPRSNHVFQRNHNFHN